MLAKLPRIGKSRVKNPDTHRYRYRFDGRVPDAEAGAAAAIVLDPVLPWRSPNG
jgi:hypothetical protein